MQTISREEVKGALDSGRDVALIEVLAPENYRKFHLPGAINVPVDDDFDENVQEAIPDKTRPAIVYCLNTECEASPKAARRMDELGYEKVYDYADGKEDWKEAGLPIEQ